MFNMTLIDFFILIVGSQNIDRRPQGQNSSNQKSMQLKVACNGLDNHNSNWSATYDFLIKGKTTYPNRHPGQVMEKAFLGQKMRF